MPLRRLPGAAGAAEARSRCARRHAASSSAAMRPTVLPSAGGRRRPRAAAQRAHAPDAGTAAAGAAACPTRLQEARTARDDRVRVELCVGGRRRARPQAPEEAPLGVRAGRQRRAARLRLARQRGQALGVRQDPWHLHALRRRAHLPSRESSWPGPMLLMRAASALVNMEGCPDRQQ